MSTSSLLLRLSILIGFLAISVTARPGRPFHPCKTLIFFSTSSSSFPQNPSGPRSITVFFTEIRPYNNPAFILNRPIIQHEYQDQDQQDQPSFPLGLYSSVGASFRDRTKDILHVVGSLLFGVGCGALTAATLYLVWSLFAPAPFSYQSDESEDEEDDDDFVVGAMKKAGYVAIPSPGNAKEVVE